MSNTIKLGKGQWATKTDSILGYNDLNNNFKPLPFDFSRASGGTFVNRQGLIEKLENLGSEQITNGDFATDSDWDKGTGWTISGGTANSNGTSGNLSQITVVTVGKIYQITITVSNYISGTVEVSAGASPRGTMTANGTYTFTQDATPNTTFYIISQSFNGSIDNVSVKEVTSIEGTPRIDFLDDSDGALLLEPQRTNLITYSNDFSATGWTELGSSVSSGFTSPDGGNNASKSVEDTSNGTHRISGQFGINFVNGETYTFSCFVKRGERDFVHIKTSSTATFGIDSYFDLANGVVGTNSLGTASIENYGNEWYRCSIVGISSNTGGTGINIYSAIIDNSNSYQGDGTSGIYIYGAQLEEASYATSYIPTYGTVSTRLGDTCSNGGNENVINSEEGVLFAEISVLSDDSTLKSLCINDGTSGNRVIIQYSNASNRLTADVRVGAVGQAFMQTFDYNVTDLLRIAVKYKANDFALWVNGLEVATVNSGLTFSANTLSKLSFDAGNSGDPFFGKTSQVQVFNTALSDFELTQLTTI